MWDNSIDLPFTRAFIERMILGDYDFKEANMTIDSQGHIRNIDFEKAFPSFNMATNLWDSFTLNTVLEKLDSQPLPPDVSDGINGLIEQFNSGNIQDKLSEFGIESNRVDDVRGRAQWFVDHPTYPYYKSYMWREERDEPWF